ncbi:hypothetical protein GCM10027275_41200 [Rhabdobacter roseus]
MSASAQRRLTYDFSHGLACTEGDGPALQPLGTPGKIMDEFIPALDSARRTVYAFEANSGLQFNNKEAKGFLDKSYTVEMYFRLAELDSWKRVLDFKNRKSDNGPYVYHAKLNFFNFATGENAPFKPGEYAHYVFSRDIVTRNIKMYVNGESKVEFIDPNQEAVLDLDQVLNFFQDDLIAGNEASAGAVAYIRLYDEVKDPVFVQGSYRRIAQNLKELKTPPPPPTKVQAETPPPPPPAKVPEPSGLVEITGKVYDGRNLSFLPNANVEVRHTDDNSVIAQARAVNGLYTVQVPPAHRYRITALSPGYEPRSIYVDLKQVSSKTETLISLLPERFDKPLVSLPFPQSKDSLDQATKTKLDALVVLLKERPDLHIQLQGHTDNVGDFEKNVLLSWQRVVMVKNYLIERGIDANRIDGQGYGSVRPIATSQSEISRQTNRRVEVWGVPTKR